MIKFRKGDIVMVSGVVKYDFPDDHGESVTIEVNGHYGSVYAPPEELTFIHHQFNVNDHVQGRTRPDGTRVLNPGYVRAINNGYAWVECAQGGLYETVKLTDLEHMPEDAGEVYDADSDVTQEDRG